VEVSAELGRLSLTFDDIMKFKVGNVLNLGKSAADGLLVKVEGLPKYKGTAGSYRGTQAVKLTEIIE
jgi:flagellar motor switch protein FliM